MQMIKINLLNGKTAVISAALFSALQDTDDNYLIRIGTAIIGKTSPAELERVTGDNDDE